jgi:hypothetical protein
MVGRNDALPGLVHGNPVEADAAGTAVTAGRCVRGQQAKEKAHRDALLARVRSAVPQDRGQAAGQFKAGQQALVGRARAVTQDPQQAVQSARSAAVTAKQQPQWLAAAGGIVALLGLRALRGSQTALR